MEAPRKKMRYRVIWKTKHMQCRFLSRVSLQEKKIAIQDDLKASINLMITIPEIDHNSSSYFYSLSIVIGNVQSVTSHCLPHQNTFSTKKYTLLNNTIITIQIFVASLQNSAQFGCFRSTAFFMHSNL